MTLIETTTYPATEVRGGASQTDISQNRAIKELRKALPEIESGNMIVDPGALYASLRNCFRCNRPYKAGLWRESTLPEPDGRTDAQLAAALQRDLWDKRISYSIALQFAANAKARHEAAN